MRLTEDPMSHRILTEEEVFSALGDLCARGPGPDDGDGCERNGQVRLLGWSHEAQRTRIGHLEERVLRAQRSESLMLDTLTIVQERCTALYLALQSYRASSGLPGLGWDCPSCRVFNGTVQAPVLDECRCCGTKRPQ